MKSRSSTPPPEQDLKEQRMPSELKHSISELLISGRIDP